MKRANAAGLKLSLPSLVLGDQHAAASSAANSSSLPPSSDAVAAGQESGHVQESGVLEPSSLSKSEWEGKESESNVAAGVPKPTREGESQSSRGSVWLRLFRRRRAGEDRRSIYNADSPLKPARSRKRNPIASSILASIPQFSNPRVYTYSNNMHQAGEPLDPLLTAQYDEPEIIQDFAEALMGDDAGMSETAESEVVIVEHSAAKGQVDAQTDADVEADAKDVQTEVKRAWRDKAPVICEGENMRLGRSNQNAEQNGKVLAQKGHALRERIFASQSGFVSGSPSSTPQRSSSSGAALSTKSVKKNTRNTRTNSELFLSAASDFAPIRERRGPSPSHSHHHQHHHHHSRSQSKSKSAKHSSHPKLHGIDNGSREGLLFTLLRFPLLLAIFLTIALEFSLYVLTRQVVNLVEYAIAWRGRKGELRKELRRAETWRDWKHWALEMDSFAGYEKWKERDASGLYDWILVKKVCNSLRVFRQKEEAEKLIGVLDLCVRNNFAGVEGFRLYSETFWGTKHLIENYVDEVEKGLEYIQRTDKLSLEAKRAFYRTAKKNLGTSALCLSGGASFGYYHCGVVRALLDANLLPKYVSGTSAGGLIAALTCTRHDSELKVLMVPELADRINACEESILTWGPRVWRIGARFEAKSFAQKAQFFTMGSTTFMEAYKRTGKVLNISVIPADRHSPVKLLNYVTSPDCVIWSALLASAAVPGILNPICLMQKTKSGRVIPWNWGHRFKDGSLRMDIPLQELQSLYNVNYPIVSQANPHVHLFFFAPKGMPGRPVAHRKGKGWRGGFFLSAAEHVLKLHLSMNFKVIRDLDLMPKLLGQDWSSTFLQAFSGAVTIWPKTRAWDWLRLLSDPDRQELKRMIHVGQSVTFPKLVSWRGSRSLKCESHQLCAPLLTST
ncbi:patatin-domain-containing protein [Tilletiaria anomala UBC 951]|uniref:Patatin-domain-containing protein n=1 Tax=Tilletiaria anomala (strain ATCC 24038 / CBS 436.72 / UBC 951) TaxID=1037660 RepID=A0A066W0N4_TILAU|nr:patatin-domain-containing protein [Tilletiaria anomala UBC 951]KDN46113.1 patatin-domain-containing protein [Tilletiaria anomala UBC 951]